MLDNIKLRIAHKNSWIVLDCYIPDDHDNKMNRTQGWNHDHHSDPVHSAVYCLRLWTVFTQETLPNVFDD